MNAVDAQEQDMPKAMIVVGARRRCKHETGKCTGDCRRRYPST
jgi:hypothetical protein